VHGERVQRVEVQQHIAAPVQRVWDRYTDHVSWTEWAGLGRVRLVRHGEPAPNGVGCVREIGSLGVTVQEEVLTWEPPRRMTYRIVRGGMPITNHHGEVVFAPDDGGTRVTWRCQFDSRVPGLGGIFQRVITAIFRRALRRLARELA
jgi:uncharacterized protein YndB with AHSA1/START domain